MGSSVYLIFSAINFPTLSPVTGSKYANYTLTIGEADGENAALDLAKTIIALFSFAVSKVLSDNTAGVSESILCQRERYPMFFLVFNVLFCVSLKPWFLHKINLAWRHRKSHIRVWRFMRISTYSYLSPSTHVILHMAFHAKTGTRVKYWTYVAYWRTCLSTIVEEGGTLLQRMMIW